MPITAEAFNQFAAAEEARVQAAVAAAADTNGTGATGATGAADTTATTTTTGADTQAAADAAGKTAAATKTAAEGEVVVDAAKTAAATTEGADKAGQQTKPEPNLPLSRHKEILRNERQRTEAAVARTKELETQLAAAGKSGASQETQDSIAELAALKDTLPEDAYRALEKSFRERDAKLDRAMAVIDKLEKQDEQRATTAQAQAQTEVETVISADPVLSQWESEVFDPETGEVREDASPEAIERWDAVAGHDKQLRASKAWKDKPMADRFAEAKRRAAVDLGIELPAAEAAKASTTTAEAKTKALPEATTQVPGSLSQLPHGRTAEVTAAAPADGLSLAQAIHATKGMDRRRAEQFLLKGG